ncbi:substrate-binding domain-containing protein [Paenibacillus sediminis]|uniref:Ribose transport system substrate-binding protein n=1 Tax=Paenibacillus sediminis TaxID=664909 RepID=A0ABS4GZY7_9BACL|nr:ribose transport system substrate-binding protein [Paenibacillus sediminis]
MNRTVKSTLWVLVAISLLILTSFSYTSTNDLVNPEKAKKIHMIAKMGHGDYWNAVKMGAEVAAKEYNVNLVFKAPNNENDVGEQIKMMGESIKQRPDAIILSASDYMALAQVTDEAAYYNVPVLSMDAEVASAKVETYIGANNYEAGQKAAERMIELTGTDSQIAIVNFVKGARNADQREEGLLDYVARYPGIKVVDIRYSDSDQRIASQLTKDILISHPDIDGIIALNAEASVGVGREVKNMGKGGKVKVIAFDNPPENMDLLQEGVVQALVVQNPFNNGYLAVQLAVEASEGKHIPDRVDTGIKLIDLDNMLWPENQKLLFPFVK